LWSAGISVSPSVEAASLGWVRFSYRKTCAMARRSEFSGRDREDFDREVVFGGPPLFSIIIAQAEARKPDFCKVRKPGIVCPDLMCQRMPLRFMRAAARVLVAASTTPEPTASFSALSSDWRIRIRSFTT